MKASIAFIFDVCFSAFVSFILSFVLLNYFVKKPFSVIFSVCLALLITLIVAKKLSSEYAQTRLKKAERQTLEIMTAQLSLYTQTEINDLFEKAINKAGYDTERKKGVIFIKNENCAVFIRFGFDGVTKTDVVKAFNSINRTEKVYIFAPSFSAEIQSFISRFNGEVIAVDKIKTYKFLNEYESLPKQKYPFSVKKPFSNGVIKTLFGRKKAKSYLAFGIIFLFMSYFVPLKLYYVICGCVFLLFSLLSRLFGKTEERA